MRTAWSVQFCTLFLKEENPRFRWQIIINCCLTDWFGQFQALGSLLPTGGYRARTHTRRAHIYHPMGSPSFSVAYTLASSSLKCFLAPMGDDLAASCFGMVPKLEGAERP